MEQESKPTVKTAFDNVLDRWEAIQVAMRQLPEKDRKACLRMEMEGLPATDGKRIARNLQVQWTVRELGRSLRSWLLSKGPVGHG